MGRNKSKLKEISPEVEVDSEKTGEEEEEVYHVEVITKARVVEYEDGTVDWEYFIKWAGYPDSASSWEPKANVRGCQRLLDSFWEHVGTDDEDYADGFQVEAKKGWIKKEKEYFKNWFEHQTVEDQEGKPEDPQEEDKLKSEISRKGKSKQLATIIIDTSDDDDKPLMKLVNRQTSQGPKRERDRSADEEDRPTKLQKKNLSESGTRGDLLPHKTETTESLRDQSPVGLFSDPVSSPEVAKPTLPQSKTVSKPTPAARSATIPINRVATKGVPLHRQRQNNPQVKMMDLNVSGGSSLATKSRIVQNPPVTTGMKPAFPSRNSSLAGLSFKKITKKPTEKPTEVKPPMPEPQLTRSPTIQTSTHDMDIDMANLFEPASAVNPSPPSPRREDPPQSMSEAPDIDNQSSEVDNFLAAIPQGPTAPVRPSDEDKEPQTGLIRKVKPLDMMKIPKKWKWSGELFVSVLADKAERFCDITIQDTTENKPDGLRFSLFFQENDSVRLKKIHDLADLNMILPSCDVVHQLARLAPRDEKDKDALHTLSKYLSCEKKFTYSSLSFVNETDTAALMLVFPPNDQLCGLFKTPEDMREDGGLLVALVPLKLRWATYRELQCGKPILPAGHKSDKELSFSDRRLKGAAADARARRLLYFPKWLHDFIPNREYCVWPTPVDEKEEVHGIPTKVETETQALLTILGQSKAKNVGCSKDRKTYLRIIFVHVGALNTLHQLPGFCEKRHCHPEMQIITYGTHPTVPIDRWGVRQIYVIGGIVTFTPNAIIKNPLGVQRLIEKIDEHPLFACYLLPSVIGLAMKMADDMGDNELRQFISEDLFMLIAEGKVALLDAPSMNLYPTPTLDRKHGWINWQLSLLPREPASLSAECQGVRMERYTNLSAPDCQSAIMEEISNDMLSMQLQPAMMDDYRRFVAITHTADGKVRGGDVFGEPHPWLEWHTLSTFRFRDNFYHE